MKFKISNKPISQIDVDDYFVPSCCSAANFADGFGVYQVTGISKEKVGDKVEIRIGWKNMMTGFCAGGYDPSNITTLVEARITPRHARYMNGDVIVKSDKGDSINALGLRMTKCGERGVKFEVQLLNERNWKCINSVSGVTETGCAKDWAKALRAMADEIDHFEDME